VSCGAGFRDCGTGPRRPIHFAVTSNPTAEWTARQLLEAFPWDNAPRYLLRDRDSIYGEKFCETAKCLGIREVLTAPRSMAKRLRGALDRIHSTGVFGPRPCLP
jgi:hypothetical protein